MSSYTAYESTLVTRPLVRTHTIRVDPNLFIGMGYVIANRLHALSCKIIFYPRVGMLHDGIHRVIAVI